MPNLADTVNDRHAEAMAAPMPTGTTAAFGPIDPRRILQLVGLNPNDPRAHAVVAVAERYGLDPVLGHIEIIDRSKRPYITRDGYLHIAHRSGQLDGIEVVAGPTRDGREWFAKVAVYRKDMSRPFVYPGRAEVTRDNGPEMSIARAERRALCRAFAVTLPREFAEVADLAEPYPQAVAVDASPAPPTASPTPETAEVAPEAAPTSERTEAAVPPATIGGGQRRAIFALWRGLGRGADEDRPIRLNVYRKVTGREVESTNDLTTAEASEVIRYLNGVYGEHERTQDQDHDQPTDTEGTDTNAD